MKINRLLGFCVVLGLLISSVAFAEDVPVVPDIPKPLNVMPSKIKPVQGGEDELSKAAPERTKLAPLTDNNELEIISPRPESSFQGDFGDGLTRADINKILNKPSKPSASAGVRKLTLKFALSPFPLLSNDEKFPENIYGLRLNYLLNLGSLDNAEKLYKLNESAPPSPLAARAGVEALIGTKQIAVACLDQKTFDENLKSDAPQFWSNVTIFCQALLGPVAGDDDELRLANASRAYLTAVVPIKLGENKSADYINSLDTITTIALLKTGHLDTFIGLKENLNIIDDKHLAILLNFIPNASSSLPLLAEGLSRGLVNFDIAKEILKSIAATTSPVASKDYLKEYFKTPDAPFLTDKLLELSVNDFVKETLLYPLYSKPEMAFPESNKILSLRLLALTNQELPPNLVVSAYGLDIPPENLIESGESLLIKTLLEKAKSDDLNGSFSTSAPLLALNYANYPQKDTKNAYDNILNLTASGNYVMHNQDILSSLKKSAGKKQMNQVVIMSLAIIDDKPLDKLHPAELYQILEALNSAGLTEETMLLTREVLGNTIKN